MATRSIPKVSTSGAAQYIGRREPFTTHGALFGQLGAHGIDSGRLNREETAAWWRDWDRVAYVVVSYITPIAWVTDDGTVHIVNQKFSLTTSKHQGRLYLLK